MNRLLDDRRRDRDGGVRGGPRESGDALCPLWLCLCLAGALVAGCSGGPEQTDRAFNMPRKARYDHYFFPAPKPEELTMEERDSRIKAEVERLATPSWEMARDELFKLGKDVIPWLIANMDRSDSTHVGIRPRPGPTVPEMKPTWSLGQVAYAVLLDFVGNYTDRRAAGLPPLDKIAWEKWWADNSGGIVVYSELGTVPAYVRKQLEDARRELAGRFTARGPVGKHGRVRDIEKERAARKQAERERERRLEARKAKAAVARRTRREAEKAKRRKQRLKSAKRAAGRKTKEPLPPEEKGAEEKPVEKALEPEPEPESAPESELGGEEPADEEPAGEEPAGEADEKPAGEEEWWK